MKLYLTGFKAFMEDKVQGGNKPKAKPASKENLLDGMWRELGIDPNSIPKMIESGPIELPEQGLWFNQAVWEVVKPIDLKDHFVKMIFHKSLSPNLNQRCYLKQEDGSWIPFAEDIAGKLFLIPINKFAEIFGKAFQTTGSPTGM